MPRIAVEHQRLADLERQLRNAAARWSRSGNRGKADAYRYSAYLVRLALKEARRSQLMADESKNLPADYHSRWELPEDERIALPAEYHQPVWMDLSTPKGWICSQCWGDGWCSDWPCAVAAKDGMAVAVAGGLEVSS